MDFLKDVLGEELFAQVAEKINAHNGDEANKDSLIKIANLAGGEYVGKGKYEALNDLLKGKETELATANGLIEELKKGTAGNEELQAKIVAYDSQVATLQEQLKEAKIKSAIKVALLSEKAMDVDYLTFKLNEKLQEKGESLELDENENIKGWEDKLSGLKVQFPTMFESAGNGGKKVIEKKLPDNNEPKNSLTKEELLKKPYQERNQIFNENPDAYREAMNN